MMKTNITNARAELYKLASSCIKYNNVININTKEFIPVEIGELHYKVDVTDEGIERLTDIFVKSSSKMKDATNADMKTIKKITMTILDDILGENAGQEVYDLCNSVFTLTNVATQLIVNLSKL